MMDTYTVGYERQKSDGELLFEAGKEIAFLRCDNERMQKEIDRLNEIISEIRGFDARDKFAKGEK